MLHSQILQIFHFSIPVNLEHRDRVQTVGQLPANFAIYNILNYERKCYYNLYLNLNGEGSNYRNIYINRLAYLALQNVRVLAY